MKKRTEFRVPLSEPALALLRRLAAVRHSDWLFPSPVNEGRSICANTVQQRCLRGVNCHPHGFRSSFRDFCGDATETPREVAEACLAHQVGNAVEQAYRRGDSFEKRRAVMTAWADFLSSGTV
jgi:integrase